MNLRFSPFSRNHLLGGVRSSALSRGRSLRHAEQNSHKHRRPLSEAGRTQSILLLIRERGHAQTELREPPRTVSMHSTCISIGINYSSSILNAKRRPECAVARSGRWRASLSTIMATAAATTAMACHLITGSSFTFHKFHDDYIDSSLAPHPPEPNTFCRSLRSAHSEALQVKHVCLSCNSTENSIHIPASASSLCFLSRETGI